MGGDLPGVRAALHSIQGWVVTCPRDVQVGPDRPLLRWRKRKWLCPSAACERKGVHRSGARGAGTGAGDSAGQGVDGH